MKKLLLLLLAILLGLGQADAQSRKKKKKPKGKKKHRIALFHKYVPPPPPPPRFDFTVFENSENPIEKIFSQDTAFYNNVLANRDKHQMQVIYTRIDRDRHNFPHLTPYRFHVDASEYFYPASTLKLPMQAMALEKLNRLNIPQLRKETRLTVDSANTCQYSTYTDSSSADYHSSIGHYIKKILLVSDNDAYNRMFEFLGTKHINYRFAELGMPQARVIHRFSPCNDSGNSFTNPFNFYNDSGRLIHRQEMLFDDEHRKWEKQPGTFLMGEKYMDFDGKMHNVPKDFSDRNRYSLEDITKTLQMLIFPEAMEKKFELTERDYRFIHKYISMYATESTDPVYSSYKGYYDCIKKYLVYGQSRDTLANKNIRIFNIVGFSYGFLVDCAYIIDLETNTEFMLSSVIYTNENKVMGDNIYEYYSIGMPFLKRLGQDFLKMEQSRPHQYKPNLEQFRFDYTQPD